MLRLCSAGATDSRFAGSNSTRLRCVRFAWRRAHLSLSSRPEPEGRSGEIWSRIRRVMICVHEPSSDFNPPVSGTVRKGTVREMRGQMSRLRSAPHDKQGGRWAPRNDMAGATLSAALGGESPWFPSRHSACFCPEDGISSTFSLVGRSLLCLRGLLVGCRHVSVRRARRKIEYPRNHGQIVRFGRVPACVWRPLSAPGILKCDNPVPFCGPLFVRDGRS
jgi:hypothetical protein